MKKFGMLLGIGILMVMLYGNAKAIADYRKSLDAPVNNDGNETIQEYTGHWH